jgi:hypothetical protein
MYERLKVPLPYTWEIYGDMKADFNVSMTEGISSI